MLLELLDLDKKNLQARTELSKIYQRRKRYDEAEKILKELLAIEPDNIHGCTEFALMYKQWADYEKKNKRSTWWEKKQLYYKYIKESYRINPFNIPTLMELCAIFSTCRQYRAALKFLEKALTARDHDLETLRHLVLIHHTLNNESEVNRLLEKGRRWIQEQPFIKYKERFQALDLSCAPHKILVQLNNTGTFSGPGRAKTSSPGSSPVILCGAGRFDLMEKYTAHNRIEDGDTVFFATYRVGVGVDEKIYADFIEPYFEDPADLAVNY
ncbi:MAG: Tetratricopeptide repeat protein [Acidobacteriota bacterium]|nr:Tetratricopeptide repeat protein [Acidobacteriota bacterium]